MSASRFPRTSPTGGSTSRRSGATDLGGLSANGDHLARGAVPQPRPGARGASRSRATHSPSALRYPAAHRPGMDGPGASMRIKLKYGSFIPGGIGRRRQDCRSGPTCSRGGDREGARQRTPERDELMALFAERRPEAGRGHEVGRSTQLRRRLPADTRHVFVVNRNINFDQHPPGRPAPSAVRAGGSARLTP